MNNKTCNTCNRTKLISEFSKAKTSKDGYHNHCKACAVIKTKLHRQKKRAEREAAELEHYLMNKAEIDAERDLERELKLYKEKQRRKEYHQKNRDKKLKYFREYHKNNPWVSTYTTNMARMKKLGQLPKLTEEEKAYIKNLYKKAHKLTIETGINHAVDHIVAISNGGLHHPENLQILTASDNQLKYFQEDRYAQKGVK